MKSATIRVTKKFIFDMAHALSGYDGPCKNIHGHTYIFSVTVKGRVENDSTNPKFGLVIDFTDLKQMVQEHIIQVFDHSLVLAADSHHAKLKNYLPEHERIHLVDYQPSAENLLLDFCQRLKAAMPENIRLHALKLEETPTSYAEWFADDQVSGNSEVF